MRMYALTVDGRLSTAPAAARLAVALLGVASAIPGRAAAQGGGDEPVLEEVVVTGLRREQKFIDAPVSVQVFDESAIEAANITRPNDYLALTPNVTFIQASHTGDAFVNIRGQTSVRGSESAVAVIVDGVQLSTLNEFNGELVDVQQIEILKGPQGALYGRNAAAGALVITTKPATGEFAGRATLGFGNWNSARVAAAAGGPLIPEKLWLRAAGSFTDSDGPFTSLVTGEKVQRRAERDGRLRLQYAPSERLSLDLRLAGSQVDAGALGFDAQVVGATVAGIPIAALDANRTDLPNISDVVSRNRQDKYSVALKADYALDFATLTSVSAWSDIVDDFSGRAFPYVDYDYPGTDFGIFEFVFGQGAQKYTYASHAFSQELRLTSSDTGRLRWMAGLYYLRLTRRDISEQSLATAGFILPTRGIDGPDSLAPTTAFGDILYRTQNYAPFGNVQLDITPDLELGLAARYDTEKRAVSDQTPDVPNAITGAPSFNACVVQTGLAREQCTLDRTFEQLQPKVTLTYKFAGTGSVFASYGRSFKSGGFNQIGTRQALIDEAIAIGSDPGLVFTQDAYDKEVADSYEIGFKSQWLARRLSINGAVFTTDVRNAQQFIFYPNSGISAIDLIDRVGIQGAELDVSLAVLDNLTVFAGGGYIDAEIREFKQNPAYVGNRPPYAADYNVNAGFQHELPLTGELRLGTRVDWSRSGHIWYEPANIPGMRRDPVGLVNARLALRGPRWEAAVWSRNLLDEQYNAEGIALVSFLGATYRAQGRSYGLEGRFLF